MALLGFFMALFLGWKLPKSAKKVLKSTKKDQKQANMHANFSGQESTSSLKLFKSQIYDHR